ncbi:MAG: hypothetical protein K0S98_2721 [Propionibacteriaceae bacterium]|jgi:hypothetical protein|nr:hypothetical protein [Propionibacteriaceae bacterium]
MQDIQTARTNLVALLDVYRKVQQPISFGYFEYGDDAGRMLINVGMMICHGMPARYLNQVPTTVLNGAKVWEMLNAGQTTEQVVDAALAQFPSWTSA